MLEGQGKNDDLMSTALAVTTGLYLHFLRILHERYTPHCPFGQESSFFLCCVMALGHLPLVRCGIKIARLTGTRPSRTRSFWTTAKPSRSSRAQPLPSRP